MEMMSLEECCEILDSMRIPITASNRKEGIYPYYGANGIQDHVADYIFDDELVLLAEDGGNFGSKTRPIAYRVSGKCWVNNHAHVLKPKEGLNVDFLCYSLMFYNTEGLVNGATRQKLTQTTMRKMLIPNLSIENQLYIVNQLNKLLKIIELRKKEIQQLDNLTKARFVEMFGDLKTNSKGWQIVGFKECADIDTNMVHNFEGCEEYPHIGIDSIEKETGRLIGYRTIAEDGVISGKYLFTPEHIIYSKIRPNLNKVAMPDFEGLCSADAYPILVKKGICNREYFGYTLRSQYFLDYILAFSNRTNLPKVNKKQVEGFALPLPPIEVQEQFADFVKQVDKSKFDTMTFAPIYAIINLYLHTYFYQGRG